MDWTDFQIEALKVRWGAGEPGNKIARDLGISRNAVLGKAHRLGLYRTKAPPPPKSTLSAKSRDGRQRLQARFLRKPAPELPPDQIKELPREKPLNGVTFLELKDKHCRWPCGNPGEPGFLFCGADKIEGCSYCVEHALMSVAPRNYHGRPVETYKY